MVADGGAHMSGLAITSLLTLFFVPAGYFLLFRFDSSPVPRSPGRQCSEGHNRSGLIDFFLQMAHGLHRRRYGSAFRRQADECREQAVS